MASNVSVATSTSAAGVGRSSLVTVATVCWNHSYLIKGFLGSLMDKTPAAVLSDVQVVVVDNGSADDTGAFLEGWRAETIGPPWKTVVRSPANLGFAAGANLAVQHATGKYLLLLNNDVEFTGDLVTSCLRAYPAGSRAILGTKLVYKPGPWNQLHGKMVRYLEGWCLFSGMEVFREIGTMRAARLTGIF